MGKLLTTLARCSQLVEVSLTRIIRFTYLSMPQIPLLPISIYLQPPLKTVFCP